MYTDSRIPVVKELYLSGKIQSLSDVFKYLPRTTLAKIANIPCSHFRNFGLLLLPDIIACSKLLGIPTVTLFEWCAQIATQENSQPHSLSESDTLKIDIIGDRIALGKLQHFPQLFEIIPRTSVATLLRFNNDRVAEMIFHPDTINIKTIFRFSYFLQLTPTIVFRLVENEWLAKAKLPIKEIKPTIKLLHNKMTA